MLFPLYLAGQQYSYVHYDVKDGLPSKRVYAICQDKDGFMWFATDNGVSRFDGSSFKTFTTEDGLPDNDIINIYCDSRNRIWFVPFKKDIAYYFKGKIHNKGNDSLLKKTFLSSTPFKIIEDSDSTIWILHEYGLQYITRNNECGEFSPKQNQLNSGYVIDDVFSNSDGSIWIVYSKFTGRKNIYSCVIFLLGKSGLQRKNSLETVEGINRNHLMVNNRNIIYPDSAGHMAIREISTGKEMLTPYFNNINTINCHDDSIIYFNTGDGVWSYTDKGRLINHYLEGKTIGRTFEDAEGSKWFTSLDDGVYKLGSDNVLHLSFNTPQPGNNEVFAIGRSGSELLAGLNSAIVAKISPGYKISYFYKDNIPGKRFDRVMQFINLPGNNVLCRSDKGICILDAGLNVKRIDRSPFKSMYLAGNTLFGGTTQNTRAWPLHAPDSVKIIIWERTTAIFSVNDSIYTGALDDLLLTVPGKKVISLGDIIPQLKTKITTIDRDENGIIWVGTYSSGLFAVKNNRLLYQVSTQNGLTSNNCRSTCLSGHYLWVGTDRGLNKIDLRNREYPVTSFTTADGLPTDIINAIFIDSNRVYTGTSEGLSWFDENKITAGSTCNLVMEEVTVDGKAQDILPAYFFSHRQQNISFRFTAISLKAAGNIIYSYRLRGLDDNWQQTSQQSLNFISLPPGNYNFELYATNKAGIKSPKLQIQFTINTPYWMSDWFKVVIFLFIIAMTWLIINQRIRAIRKKETEKNKVQQQISELEQKAKRAQMNPHFIFNCISSIQHFIFSNELEACNDYLARFARLIRQTLDNSERSAIQLSEEVKYLDTYLSLEQMRFTGKFRYQINVSPEIHADFIHLPPMLIQPYVENSIRHGVRNRRDHNGLITIDFYKKDNSLCCRVQDNGIGRKMAETLKGASHIEYQSKGMSLTNDRINAINQSYGEQTAVSITDLTGENAESTGTAIVIRFPLTLLEKLK